MKAVVTACFLWAALSSSSAVAADLVSAAAPEAAPVVESRWTYSITPYFWAAGLSGETSQFDLPTVDIDADFSEIFDNLDFAAMLIGEARNGPYSLFGDLIYTKLGASRDTPLGLAADSTDVEASTFAGLVGAGYSVLEALRAAWTSLGEYGSGRSIPTSPSAAASSATRRSPTARPGSMASSVCAATTPSRRTST